MQGRSFLWCSALCSVALWCAFDGPSYAAIEQEAHRQAPPPTRILRNERVGYTFTYPRAWRVGGQVVATQFAVRAPCQSVRIVDRPGPSEVRQSFVQICSKRVTDGLTLAGFMRKTYGRRLSKLFAMTRLGGVPAYRTRSGKLNRTFFLQTQEYRLQLVAGVVAAPARRAKRLAQVNRILASFSLTG